MTTASTPGRLGLAAFNTLSRPEAGALLTSCLAVPRWVESVTDGRPYADRAALREHAMHAAAELDDAELGAALERHPRIGERASSEHDVEHSRREQAGVDPADAEIAARLAAGNRAYEARFERVFLIRASGRSASEILAELDRRLGNDDAAERAETVTQLREIALLRLESLV